MTGINALFLLAAMLLFISVVASTLSARLGVPLLLLFLVVGMLAGEEGPGGIAFDDFFIASLISQGALAVILLDGGLRTQVSSFRYALKPAAVMATFGVIATVAFLGMFATWLMDVPWAMGFLLASIVGSTDAAAVFSLLRNSGVRLSERVQATLEIESGANDPMAILLVTAFVSILLQPEQATAWSFGKLLGTQMGLGLLFGLAGGWVLATLMRKLDLAEGMYALLILSGGMIIFAITNLLNGSGFLAIFIAGIFVGNQRYYATEHVLKVMDGMAWLAQASMFVVLGMLVTPSQMLEHAGDAILVSIFLALVARPLAVLLGLLPFNYRRNELVFISWVGLRGAVPVTLAIVPVAAGVENAMPLFVVAFAVVLQSLLIQGSTIPWFARRCKVTMPPRDEPLEVREVWVGDEAALQLLAYKVEHGSLAEGRHPDDVAAGIGGLSVRCVALVREGDMRRLAIDTRLSDKDLVWYVAPEEAANKLAVLFSAGSHQADQREFFGQFNVDPTLAAGDLAAAYGLTLAAAEYTQPIGRVVEHRLGREPVAGDHVEIGAFSLIVREVEEGEISSIGLKFPRATPAAA